MIVYFLNKLTLVEELILVELQKSGSFVESSAAVSRMAALYYFNFSQ